MNGNVRPRGRRRRRERRWRRNEKIFFFGGRRFFLTFEKKYLFFLGLGEQKNFFGEKFFFSYKSIECNVPAFQNGIKLYSSSNGCGAVSINVKKCIFLEIQNLNILTFKMKQNFEFFVQF